MIKSVVHSPWSVVKILVGAAVLLFLLPTTDCRLPTAWAVEVEPARLELTIPADEPTQGQMEIRNRSAGIVGVRIQAGPYRFLQTSVRMSSAESWLTFEPESFTLAAGATTSVRYTIRPPENVADDTAGEYVAAILVDELPADATGDAGEVPPDAARRISIIPRLALPVYLQIQGRQLRQVEVSEMSAKKERPRLLRIETTLRNRGTVHVRPEGALAVFKGVTSQLYRGAPLGKSLPLLPTASLAYPVVMPLPEPGRYRAVVTVAPYDGGEIFQRESAFEVTEEGEVIQTQK